MIGSADIRIRVNAYSIYITGLAFRWFNASSNAVRIPEANGLIGPSAVQPEQGGREYTLLRLPEDKSLRNGVGELQVLYNDGEVRITKDLKQQLSYIHVREEIMSSLLPGIA
mmetsp:Transcript_31219/g.42947  ORF Transcript_31219/g.42947 Transcript_31219/m.42947 type:complete len:112 (-) Transcript_31219:93-428(-)